MNKSVYKATDPGNWLPEDSNFWISKGKRIAYKNLWISVFCLFLSFCVWFIWSGTVVHLKSIGFNFTNEQLFDLVALCGIVGATMRIPNAFIVAMVGGKNWIVISTLYLAVPAYLVGKALQDPQTSYSTFLLLSVLCGLSGGNFSSSMANITSFFPRRKQGLGLGINAGIGNLGASAAQLVATLVTGVAMFGAFGGGPEKIIKDGVEKLVWMQNIAYFWLIPIILAAIIALFWMDNLKAAIVPLKTQLKILKNKNTYIASWLYTASFGSYIGYAAAFPLVMKIYFPEIKNLLAYAWIGPFVGAVLRTVGGWLSDKVNSGTKVAFCAFLGMIIGVVGVIYFTAYSKDFCGFFAFFLLIFAASGVGNGSVFRMMGLIFDVKEKGSAIGLSAAFAAYGAFMSPEAFKLSMQYTNSLELAMFGAIVYYVITVLVLYKFYMRKDSIKC